MKKLTVILMVLLCAFSLSAEWGRIQYVDEFGDVDPTISDPYQIASGTREVNGNTNYHYEYRLIAFLPKEFGYPGVIEIDMFDDFGDYVVFDAGDEATIRVKLNSGEIKEFSYDFTEYEYPWYDEYELDQVRQNIYLNGHDAVDLLNELYNGNDLRFVIYNGNIKYTFTIEAEGFREVADELIKGCNWNQIRVVNIEGYDVDALTYFVRTGYQEDDVAIAIAAWILPVPEENLEFVGTENVAGALGISQWIKDPEDEFWHTADGYSIEKVSISVPESSAELILKRDEAITEGYICSDPETMISMLFYLQSSPSVDLAIRYANGLEYLLSIDSDLLLDVLNQPEAFIE